MSMQSKHTWEIWEGSFPPCPCSVTSRWYSQIFNHSDRAFSGGHFEVCIGCTWQGPYDGRPSYRVQEDYSHAVAQAFVACRYKLHDMPKFYLFLPGSITIVVTPTTTIGQQLVADCHKLGITAVSGAQVMLDIFLAWHGIFPCLNLYMSSINHFPLPLT